jgi:hypothetical protein
MDEDEDEDVVVVVDDDDEEYDDKGVDEEVEVHQFERVKWYLERGLVRVKTVIKFLKSLQRYDSYSAFVAVVVDRVEVGLVIIHLDTSS